PRWGVLVELELGASFRYAYHEGLPSGRIGLLLGAQEEGFSAGLVVQTDLGTTLRGLDFRTLSVGLAFESRAGPRLHVGGGGGATLLLVRAVTEPTDIIDVALGTWVRVTYDVWLSKKAAIFLGPGVGVDFSLADGSFGVSGFITLGYRNPLPRPSR